MTRANSNFAVSADSPLVLLPTAMAFLWSRTSFIGEFWDVVQRVGAWPGARIVETRGGLTIAVNEVTLGRLKWGGQLVLAFGPEARRAIADEKMSFDTSDQRDEDVVVFNIRSATDVDRALCLLRFTYLISDLDRNQFCPSRAVDTEVGPVAFSEACIPTPFSTGTASD